MEQPDKLLQRIRENPHWRVSIRPDTPRRYRISTPHDGQSAIESCLVPLAGRAYPHVDEGNIQNRADGTVGWHESGPHREYWYLSLSGEFDHYFSFAEDYHSENIKRHAKSSLSGRPEGFRESGYLVAQRTLRTTTRIFRFASCLAEQGILGDGVLITLQMREVADRVLVRYSKPPPWDCFCRATEDELAKEWTLAREDLVSRSDELARNAAAWLFGSFGWEDPSAQLILGWQRSFLEGSWGDAKAWHDREVTGEGE